MGQPNIISENLINHIIGVKKGGEFKRVNWHNAELNIKPLLTFGEFTNAVMLIIRDCIDKDGKFIPEMLDFSFRVNTIASYLFIDLPKDFDRLYYIVYESDLYDTMCRSINKAQLSALRDAVERRLYLYYGGRNGRS